jgi:2,4-dienoyl-CoA reductase-like NADH-dependent reductase (Old Yellow Enzyme family)/NADPH-dependent glutamate synthase beta subunit-like oxidoreductase
MTPAARQLEIASLFEPYKLKGLTIKNRFMRSPMVVAMAAPDGTVTDDLLDYYRVVAEGGVGLACTGCMAVNAEARMTTQQLGVWDDAQIPGLSRLADTVHAHGDGCAFFAQIFSEGAHSWGYSYGQEDAGLDVTSLSEDQILEIVEAFGQAARRVREAGFDGVHLHGGHGYLISQFLSPAINRRTDEWGGSVERRARFALEIAAAVRAQVGPDYPLGIKMNTADYLPGGHWYEETSRIAQLLAAAGVDLIEMSGGMGFMIELRQALLQRAGEREYYFWEAVAPFRRALKGSGVALAAVGGIRTSAVMAGLREQGIDLISMARPWLCEPDLARRIRAGDLRAAKCVSGSRLCNLCLSKLAKGSVQCERFYPGDCRMTCPIDQDNPAILARIADGDLAGALEVIKADNPLANSTARVCHAPCETACRGKNGEPLSLRAVKRYITDWGLTNGVATKAPPASPQRREKVAVIGSGPAGLTCAFYLARLGYRPTVLEREDVAGGVLAWGIPAFRLPPEVVQADVDYVSSAGVKIRTGCTLGRDFGLADLRAEGYAAVFLALGTPCGVELTVPGAAMPGVVQGIDFLRDLNLNRRPAVGRRVVIIGGGNVAIDAALATLHLGAERVKVACLEQLGEMPAYREEVERAVAEGVEVKPGWGPRRIVGEASVAAVELVRCESVFDDWGSFKPAFCEDVAEIVEADQIIVAVGQRPGEEAVPAKDWIFSGGDFDGSGGTVTDAMAAGRMAAEAIDEYFAGRASAGQGRLRGRVQGYAPFVPMRRPTAFKDVAELTPPERSERTRAPLALAAGGGLNLGEVAGGLEAAEVAAEACRCMKYDRDLEAESLARLAEMGPAAFVLSPQEDPLRR